MLLPTRSILAIGLALCTLTTQAADERVFELRTYVTNEGKMPDLLKRFREHTCRLFEKHGIENIGYWQPIEKAEGADNTLIYIIARPSLEAVATSRKAFGADPEWKDAYKASEAAGPILAKKPDSILMRATDYTCPIVKATAAGERVFELRIYTTPDAKLPSLDARFRDHTMGLFTKHGMSHIGYWHPTDVPNKLYYVLSHASKEAGSKSFDAFRADADWVKAKAASEAQGSLTVQPGGVQSIYMKATDFSPTR
jgi:hypothetical protein